MAQYDGNALAVRGGMTRLPAALPALPTVSYVGRRRAVAPAKCPIKVRQIVEPHIVGDGADGTVGVHRTREHAISVCQALIDHKFGKTHAFGLEQLLEVSQGHAV